MTADLREATGTPLGPPLVLCNGLGASQRSWNRLVDALGPDVTALRFEYPDTPGEVPTIRGHADAAAEAMDTAGVDRAVLAGWSFGGLVAQEFGRRHGDRLCGLALVSSSIGAPSWPPTAWGAGEVAGLEVWRHVKALPTGTTQRVTRVAQRSAAVMRWSSVPWLSDLDVPTLVAHGWLDQVVPVPNGLLLASLIPGARLELRLDGAHYLPHRRPQWLARLLRELLETVENRTTVTA